MDAWEREHGHSPETLHRDSYHGYSRDPLLPHISDERAEEGADLYATYLQARRNEDRTRRVAETERSELLTEELGRHLFTDS